MGQVVDTPTAQEFMREALEKITPGELEAVAALCERKATLFHGVVHGAGRGALDETALRTLFAHVFSVRRKTEALFASVDPERLGGLIRSLVDGTEPLLDRFNSFVGALDGFDPATDLAAEILHFTDPERFWPWARWMWDPSTDTGSLRLVTMDEFDLHGATPGEVYFRVGEAVDFVRRTGDAAGFTRIGDGTFGMDVFLACVYGIYMYTVLRMRMTQEFNKVVPELPELSRRLLGVHRLPADGPREGAA
ncbi:MAG: hypothetical protein WEB06_10280 [Actinomycetota bacterium]